jgi:chromosome segregation ATPase
MCQALKCDNWLTAVETAELERLEAAATKARDAWSAKSDRLAEAQKQLQELQQQLQKDYGPDDAFLALEVGGPRTA